MTVARERRGSKRAEDFGWEWLVRPDGLAPGIVSITRNRQTVLYYLTELAVPRGRGFRLVRLGVAVEYPQSESYDVYVEGAESSCECPGWMRHRTECKHLRCCREITEEEDLERDAAL